METCLVERPPQPGALFFLRLKSFLTFRFGLSRDVGMKDGILLIHWQGFNLVLSAIVFRKISGSYDIWFRKTRYHTRAI